jgi:hypothetical protein
MQRVYQRGRCGHEINDPDHSATIAKMLSTLPSDSDQDSDDLATNDSHRLCSVSATSPCSSKGSRLALLSDSGAGCRISTEWLLMIFQDLGLGCSRHCASVRLCWKPGVHTPMMARHVCQCVLTHGPLLVWWLAEGTVLSDSGDEDPEPSWMHPHLPAGPITPVTSQTSSPRFRV